MSGWHLGGHSKLVGSHAKQDPYVDPLPSAASCSAANPHGAHDSPSGDGLTYEEASAFFTAFSSRMANRIHPKQ
ncbi:hypothetical protein F441_21865 [Phytophthora nicotianae CJ01A1]|uniref:Uncharacterized protein n=4 Tax=Phytophthora nicotianae TaxID=4792 RepID=V9DWF5_PHYNI|nr:hypothetical protein F443_21975 [Phytophthora nicotianae P1569]ETO59703.1 hypothetical protein F444_21994 [Phytophthora nicotianae P1976]ETP00789.1 hypothetical protein F441_21865 [Phytophthora nicotianae CJ01A1]ETP28939.1 hypothetical protein F442_21837 [Phytophthora nicotianae P10297]